MSTNLAVTVVNLDVSDTRENSDEGYRQEIIIPSDTEDGEGSLKTTAYTNIGVCVPDGFGYLEKLILLALKDSTRNPSIYKVTHSATQMHYKFNIPFETQKK